MEYEEKKAIRKGFRDFGYMFFFTWATVIVIFFITINSCNRVAEAEKRINTIESNINIDDELIEPSGKPPEQRDL